MTTTGTAVELVHAPAQPRERKLGAEEPLRGDAADAEDHRRCDELDLPAQVRQAPVCLFRAWIAVVGGRHFTTFAI